MSADTHVMTARIPVAVYEELRQLAFDERVSVNSLLVRGARAFLAQKEASKMYKGLVNEDG